LGSDTITYVCVTQNRVENLRRNFPQILPYVDRAVIIDGGSADETEVYCKSQPKVEWHYRKWDDSFANQYNEYLKHIDEGWVLLCDDDELPSKEMLEALRGIVADSGDGETYSCVEFRSWSINSDDETPKDHPDDYWRKILFLYSPGMKYQVDLHQCLMGYKTGRHARSNLVYYHIKSIQDVARNACRNYFIAGIWLPNSTDGLRGPEWMDFRAIVKRCYPEVGTFSDLNSLFIKGGIHQDLKDWIISHKDYGSNLYHEVHHYFEYYFEMLHPEEVTPEVNAAAARASSEKTYFDIDLVSDTWSPAGDSRDLGIALTSVNFRKGGEWYMKSVLDPSVELVSFNGIEGGNSGTNFSWSGKESKIRLYGLTEAPDEILLQFAWPPRPGQNVAVKAGGREASVSRTAVIF